MVRCRVEVIAKEIQLNREGGNTKDVLSEVRQIAAKETGLQILQAWAPGDWDIRRNDNTGIILWRDSYFVVAMKSPTDGACLVSAVLGRQSFVGDHWDPLRLGRYKELNNDLFPEIKDFDKNDIENESLFRAGAREVAKKRVMPSGREASEVACEALGPSLRRER